MLYALERESDHGSTLAVLVELSEGGDVSGGPVSRVWNLTSNGLPLDQSLQRDRTGRPRGSKQSPAQLLARDPGADREHHPRATGQTPVLGCAQAQGEVEMLQPEVVWPGLSLPISALTTIENEMCMELGVGFFRMA